MLQTQSFDFPGVELYYSKPGISSSKIARDFVGVLGIPGSNSLPSVRTHLVYLQVMFLLCAFFCAGSCAWKCKPPWEAAEALGRDMESRELTTANLKHAKNPVLHETHILCCFFGVGKTVDKPKIPWSSWYLVLNFNRVKKTFSLNHVSPPLTIKV